MADTRDGRNITVSELRQHLADTLHEVAVNRTTVYVTNRGRRIAAIVPAPTVEHLTTPSGCDTL